MFSKTKYFFLSLLVLIGFSSSTYAEGDTYCTGRITGVTNPQNSNAGQISFNSHEGFGNEDGEAVDFSIIDQAPGLAPASREYAACVNDETGTYAADAYEYGLHGFSWNDNLGFISYGCQDGKNRAGEGLGVDCGNIDYGVYIDDANELFGYAYNSVFGWMQFRGQGMLAPEPTISDVYQIDLGDAMLIIFEGQEYELEVVNINPYGGAEFTVNGVDPSWSGYDPWEEIYNNQILYEDIFINYVSSSYDEADGVNFWWRFTLEKIPAAEACADALCGVGGEVFDYGVTMDADGYLHGYAWTEAGIWVDFEGAKIDLPDQDADDDEGDDDGGGDGTAWCEGKSYICVEVRPNPVTLDFDAGGDQEIRIADGTDGYYVHLFLMDGTGDNPLALPVPPVAVTNFLNSIQINWQDTVKINQANGAPGDVGDLLSTVEGFNPAIVKQPWATKKGAVTYKPLTFADFDSVSGEPGYYISKFKVSSYAPTDDGNLSWTTSTDPKYLVNNTEGRGEVESNQLILESITYDALSSGALQLPAGAAYPNGKVNLHLPFRPAIEVNTLYSGVIRDTLVGYRAVPENVAIGMRTIGALPAPVINAAAVRFGLGYSQEETQSNCPGANFDFHFLNNLAGTYFPETSPSVTFLTGLVKNLTASIKDIQVIATLPVVEGDEALPCNYAEAPTLYSRIQYRINAANPTVYYYHNDLPRISGSGVFNPQIVVQGKIVAQKITGVTSLDNLQSSGSGVVSAVREIINKNVEKYIGTPDLDSGEECLITDLSADSYTEDGCSETYFEIGDEKVLYSRDADIVLDLDGGYDGQWVLVADGGDIFVHGDAYNGNPDLSEQRLSLLAIKNDSFKKGNVYLGPCSEPEKTVKNLQATIVVDGGLYSYTGNKDEIDDDGRPAWDSAAARVDALGCQLLLEGAIYAPGNTIGGADADRGSDPRPFILLGGGEVIELPVNLDDRMKAQNDDLNYLRLFRLELEISPEGLPIDQRCGMGLSPADTLAIIQSQLSEGPVVCGESQPCDASAAGITYTSPNVCDGINPFDPWIGGNAYGSGDLVPPQNQEFLADRLDNAPDGGGDGDFDPVYVFYVAPDSDSFVFSEAGGF